MAKAQDMTPAPSSQVPASAPRHHRCRSATCLSLMNRSHGVDEEYPVEDTGPVIDRGDAEGCFMLGALFANGLGVSKDPARAKQLYAQSLRHGICKSL